MKKIIKWIDNYWYHYKWHTLIAAFFIAVFAVCGTQMLHRDTYDAYILYAGGDFFSADEEHAMLNALSGIAQDYDKNGTVSLCMTKMFVLSEQELDAARSKAEAEGEKLAYNAQTRAETIEQFDLEIMTGKAYICLLSEDMYERCAGKDRFIPLAQVLDRVPESAYDEYAVRLSDTEFGSYFSQAFEPIGEKTLVCLRQISFADAQNKNARADYEDDCDLFRRLLEFTVKK